jgi:hypothetical protein
MIRLTIREQPSIFDKVICQSSGKAYLSDREKEGGRKHSNSRRILF